MAAQDDATIGDAIRAALKHARWKQSALASSLEIHPTRISKLVNGHESLTANMARRIDAVLGSDLGSLMLQRRPPVDLFVSSPITAVQSDRLHEAHDKVAQTVAILRQQIAHVLWPGEGITDATQLKDADLATEENIPALARAKALLYVQYEEVTRPSSALIELGYALGRGIKTTIVISKGLALPFMLSEHFEGVARNTDDLPKARVRMVESFERAAGLLKRDGRELLGLSEDVAPRDGRLF